MAFTNGNRLVRSSLLDRLFEKYATTAIDYRSLKSHAIEEYKRSIIRDLNFLFNTRSTTPADEYDKSDLSVVDYGIPDFSHYTLESESDRILLVKRVLKAIKYFEPRLENIEVYIHPELNDEKSFSILINAYLIVETVSYQVSFTSKNHIESGQWEIYETN